jgi:hypothetical protein
LTIFYFVCRHYGQLYGADAVQDTVPGQINPAAFFRKVVFYSLKTFRGILKEGRLLFPPNIPQHSSGKLFFIPTKHSAAFFRKVVFYSPKTFRGILQESRLLFTQNIPRHFAVASSLLDGRVLD